jgi:glyoxylate carboligase
MISEALGYIAADAVWLLLLQDAKHPLLVIGAGANRKVTSNMLRRLVENTGLPFCDTQMGKGVIDSSARHTRITCTSVFYSHAWLAHSRVAEPYVRQASRRDPDRALQDTVHDESREIICVLAGDPRYMGTAALSDGDYIHAVMSSAGEWPNLLIIACSLTALRSI